MKQQINLPKRIWIFLISAAVITSLSIVLIVFNWQQRHLEINLEITFVNPHQAIVFWRTAQETLSYVKFGEKPNKLDKIASQLSSTPSQIHTVMLNDLPLEGVYITLHNASDSIFYRPQTFRAKFDPTLLE